MPWFLYSFADSTPVVCGPEAQPLHKGGPKARSGTPWITLVIRFFSLWIQSKSGWVQAAVIRFRSLDIIPFCTSEIKYKGVGWCVLRRTIEWVYLERSKKCTCKGTSVLQRCFIHKITLFGLKSVSTVYPFLQLSPVETAGLGHTMVVTDLPTTYPCVCVLSVVLVRPKCRQISNVAALQQSHLRVYFWQAVNI